MKTSARLGLLVAALGIAAAAHAQSTFNKYQPANGVQCNTGLTFIDTACTSSQIPAGGSTGTLQFKDLSTGNLNGNSSSVVASDGGLVLGGATGGSKGPGTINASALYIAGLAVGTSSGAVSTVGLSDGSTTPIYTISGSPVISAGTLTFSLMTQTANKVFASGASGGAAQPGFRALVIADIPTIPAAHTSGFATVATTGAYSDLTGLPTIPTAANPSGSIGLSAVNGTAATFLRSDGHPALDQSISPTMTGTWYFDGARGASSAIQGISVGTAGVGGGLSWVNPTGATNAKLWDFTNGAANDLQLRLIDDAYSSAKAALDFTRSGLVLTGVTVGNATDLPTITLAGPTVAKAINALGVTAPSTSNLGIAIGTDAFGDSEEIWQNSGATADNRLWTAYSAPGGSWQIGTLNDALSTVDNALEFTRSSTTVSSIVVGNPTDKPQTTIYGSTTVNGASGTRALTVNGVSGFNALDLNQVAGQGSVLGLNGNNGAQNWDVGGALSASHFQVYDVTNGILAFDMAAGGDTIMNAGSGSTLVVQNGGTNHFVVGAGVAMPNLGSSTSAQTGYLCWITGTGALSVDPTNTCLVSSIRYKQKVVDLGEGLDAVMKLRPVSYEYKTGFMPKDMDPGRQVGFIAEEVQKVDPRLTPLDKEGKPRSVEYAQMSALLVRAIQDQQQEIWELKLALGALAVVTLTWLSALTWKRRHGC